jgi:hypothetical protein
VIFATLKGMKRAILSLSLFFVALFSFFPIAGAFVPRVNAQGFEGVTGGAGTAADDSVGESACRFVTSGEAGACKSCFEGGGAWTAIGCLGGETPNDFIASFLKIGTGLGGGVAFLLILFSGFQRITSAGNPEKLHEAKELMTAAVSGLLLIIFSIFLLRLIGVDILQIPGLN